MTSTQQLLIVVLDDDREDVLPRLTKRLSGAGFRVKGFFLVEDAMIFLSRHAADSDDPVDILIIDNEMPVAAGQKEVRTAGVTALNLLRDYRLRQPSSPAIVYSAYGDIEYRVRAAIAGATDYIEKTREDRIGIDDVVEWCENYERMRKDESGPHIRTPGTWLDRNEQWLIKELPGLWVALIALDEAQVAGLEGCREHDDVVIISGESYDAVRAVILSHPQLYSRLDLPAILRVPRDS